jgi:hypothetical protein
MRSECAILAGMARATLPESKTPWRAYADNYDRIRDTMARVLDGFEDFNAGARHPHGIRIRQLARDRVFLTPSGRAEVSLGALADDVDPGNGRLLLTTIRSHDQFNTTIYSNDDRYRGLKGLRTVVFMNEEDMRDRELGEFDLVDIKSFSKMEASGWCMAIGPSAMTFRPAVLPGTCRSSTCSAGSPTTALRAVSLSRNIWSSMSAREVRHRQKSR